MTDAPTTGHCHNENYMKTTHPFVAPVLGSTQSKVNMEAYEQAIDQYNEGNYLGAFYQLLDHLNPEFRTKYGNANGTEFHIPHGSILVHIRIADDRLEDLKMFRRIDGHMSGHVEMKYVPGVDMSTGSLGQGISVAVGMALAGKVAQKDYRVYAILGDCEVAAVRMLV